MERFSHIQAFSLSGDNDKLQKEIKSFLDVGWEYIGETPILSFPLISVGWLKEKGDVIYPDYTEPK